VRRLIPRSARLAFALVALVSLVPPTAALAAPSGSISGTVSDAATHQPIAGVRVCATSESFFEEVAEFCSHSAANGTYSIGELPEDSYAVEFTAATEGLNYVYQAWEHQPDPFGAKLVKVTSGGVTGIDAELSEGGMIGGLVTNHSNGAPIAGVEVCAEPQSLDAVNVCTNTGGTGQYTLIGLTGGDYRVEFRPPEELEFLDQWFDGEPGGLQADLVTVQVGQLTPNVNASLLETGQISGQVTDALTGAPVAGVSACAEATLGRFSFGPCGQSGADGRYLIRRVPAGTYTVHYYTGETSSGYRPGEYTGACGSKPVAVAVAAGALTTGIDARLVPSSSFASPPECVVPTPQPLPATPNPKPKPKKRCRKGTKPKVVHGKRRCVKAHKPRHHKRHPAHAS
jgi:carboxypeptidase family protein